MKRTRTIAVKKPPHSLHVERDDVIGHVAPDGYIVPVNNDVEFIKQEWDEQQRKWVTHES